MSNEGIFIPKEVDKLIVDAVPSITAGDKESPGAKLLNLKLLAMSVSNGKIMDVDGGVVYKLDYALSPEVIAIILSVGCEPVNYYEKEIVNGKPKKTKHPLKVFLSISIENENNPSYKEGMTWLDLANEHGMFRDETNLYFNVEVGPEILHDNVEVGPEILHDDVTILRDNPTAVAEEIV